MKYRNELKYLIDINELEIIKSRLVPFMDYDKNAKKGKYVVTSVYFDDFDNSGYYDVDDGIDIKKKYRIRIYNHSDKKIMLEVKHKKNNLCAKESIEISKEECEEMLKGKYLRNIDQQDDILKELTYNIMANQYKPITIVEYERIPFVYRNSDIRVTLDMNISSSDDTLNFLVGHKQKRPILAANNHLLEIKYDDYFPSYIKDCFNDLNLEQISFSKYYLCRKYNRDGGILL